MRHRAIRVMRSMRSIRSIRSIRSTPVMPGMLESFSPGQARRYRMAAG